MDSNDLREQYRPRSFKEVVGNEMTKRILIKMVESGKMPKGILFHGPAGSGKTSLAYLLVKGLLCEKFSGDVCGKCTGCKTFEQHRSEPIDFWYHDCTKITRRTVDEIVASLKYPIMTKQGQRIQQIHVFDEFHRASEPIQDKFLTPLERIDNILLIFCLIDLKDINKAFLQRVTVLKTTAPGIDDLVPWLKGICKAEGIDVKSDNALKQLAETSRRLPRACLSLLEKAILIGEPLTTSLVKHIAGEDEGYTVIE